MPDPTPNDGFTFYLNEAEKATKESIPAADLLAATWKVLLHQEWLGGTGIVDEAAKVQYIYHDLTDYLGQRQAKVAAITQDIGNALQEVIDLYRRADGQA